MEYYPVDQDLVLRNIKYGDHKLQSMDVYLPASRSVDHTKILVYIHSGDWSTGDKDDISLDDNTVSILKEHFPNYALFNVNYRLAGDSSQSAITATDAEADILRAMDHIYEQAHRYQISTDTYMAGLESGAQLASLYTLKSAGVSSKVKGCMVFSGAYDLSAIYQAGNPATQQALQVYIGGSLANHPDLYQAASPNQYVSVNSPSFLIVHNENNSKFPISQAEEFAQRLSNQHIDHEFIKYDSKKDSISMPDMEIVFNQIKTFLQK